MSEFDPGVGRRENIEAAATVLPPVPEAYLQPISYYDAANKSTRTMSHLEMLRQHVAAVRQTGDVLDQLPIYRQAQLGARVFALPAAISAASVAATANLPHTGGGTGLGPLSIAAASAGIAAGLARWKMPSHTQRRQAAYGAIAGPVPGFMEDGYDLFRVAAGHDEQTGEERHEVHMHYYSSSDAKRHPDGTLFTAADYVKNMATVAAAAGVDHLMISEKLASQLAGHYKGQTANEWLDSHKPRVYLEKNALAEIVVTGTPHEWQTARDKLETSTQHHELAGLIDCLASVSPGHPLVEKYKSIQEKLSKVKEPEKRHELLRQALNPSVDRAIAGTFLTIDTNSTRDIVAGNYKAAEQDTLAGRTAYTLSAALQRPGAGTPYLETIDDRGNDIVSREPAAAPPGMPPRHTVVWKRPDATVERQDLASTIGINGYTKEHIETLLRYARERPQLELAVRQADEAAARSMLDLPELNTKLVRDIAIMMLARRLDTTDEAVLENLPSVRPVTAAAVERDNAPVAFGLSRGIIPPLIDAVTVSAMHTRNSIAAPSARVKLLRGVGALLGLGFVVLHGAGELEENRQAQLDAAQEQVLQQYAREYGVAIDRIDPHKPEIEAAIHGYAQDNTFTSLTYAWDWGRQRQADVNTALNFDWVGDLFSGSGDGNGGSGNGDSDKSRVGDQEFNGPPKEQWHLEGHGMSTEGYWASSTSNVLEFESDGDIYWHKNNNIEKDSGMIATSYTNDEAHYIKVSGDVADATFASMGEDGRRWLRVPVLEGTSIFAANLDGKPMKLATVQGGTTILAPIDPSQDSGKLEYWVVKVGDSFEPRPYAVSGINVIEHDGKFDYSGVPVAWERRIPGFDRMEPAEKRAELEAYISTNYRYTLMPPEQKMGYREEYVEKSLTDKLADCDVAFTVMAIGTLPESLEPGKPIEGVERPPSAAYLNGVSGYHNEADSSLTDRERHMWGTSDKWDGVHTERYDPTPERFARTPVLSQEELPSDVPLYLLAAAATSAALAFAGRQPMQTALRRRRAVYAAQATARAKANHVAKTEELFGAVAADAEALHQAIDILEALRHDPNMDITAAVRRGTGLFSDRSLAAGMARLEGVAVATVPVEPVGKAFSWLLPGKLQATRGLAANQLQLSSEQLAAFDEDTRQAVDEARRLLAAGHELFTSDRPAVS